MKKLTVEITLNDEELSLLASSYCCSVSALDNNTLMRDVQSVYEDHVAQINVRSRPHLWEEIDSQFSSEKFSEVVCRDCKVHGEINLETKEVYFPAT